MMSTSDRLFVGGTIWVVGSMIYNVSLTIAVLMFIWGAVQLLASVVLDIMECNNEN